MSLPQITPPAPAAPAPSTEEQAGAANLDRTEAAPVAEQQLALVTTAGPLGEALPFAPFALAAQTLRRAFVVAGIDGEEQLGLMNLDGALDALGSRLPLLAIEYLAKKESKDAGLEKGLWTFRHTGEQAAQVEAIFAAAKLQRMWREKFDPRLEEQPAPWCFSQDGRTPTAGAKMQRCACAACPKAKWGRDSAGKRTPPECADHQIVMLLVRDAEVPERVSPMVAIFKRTGLAPYRQAMDIVRARAMQWGAQFPPAMRHLAVGFTLGSVEEGIYFRPTFTGWRAVTPEEGAGLAQLVAANLQSFRDVDLMQLDEPTEEQAEPDAGFDPGAYEAAGQSTGASSTPATTTAPPAGPRRF